MPDMVQHTLTPQHAYGLLRSEHGIIDATSFAHTLVDGRGNVSWLACQLMAWIMDWHRPADGGGPRYHGRLWVPSAELATRWNTSTAAMERARSTITRAGLARFVSVQHTCWVEVDWSAVARALEHHASIVGRHHENAGSGSDTAKTRGLNDSDTAKTRGLNTPDPAKTRTILPYTSALEDSPPSAESGACEEEEVQHTTDKAYAIADRLVAYGTERGRRCDGAWAQAAREAVRDALRDGRDPKVLEAAWTAYIGRDGSARTDLAHWIRGQGLTGEPRDEGALSFEVVYEQVQHTYAQAQERRRIQQGGVPEHPHFAPSQAGWVVGWEGHGHVLYDAVPASASEAEARAAFPDWYRHHG